MGSSAKIEPRVVFFDGVCNLCNQSVLFIIQRDPKAKFKFATLQSPFAKAVLKKQNWESAEPQSVLLFSRERLFDRSRAALEIARGLNGLWPLLYAFIIIPPFLRNSVYDWVARNRYRWFGKKNECMIPTRELRNRFIE
jgi:predicted DCC family thiol-disulfide oxidoreductase YuxK